MAKQIDYTGTASATHSMQAISVWHDCVIPQTTDLYRREEETLITHGCLRREMPHKELHQEMLRTIASLSGF